MDVLYIHKPRRFLRGNTSGIVPDTISSKMANGTVKFFNTEKGFGFITPDDGGKDLFVHKSGTRGPIRDGDKVEYDVEQSPKGPNAVNVSKV